MYLDELLMANELETLLLGRTYGDSTIGFVSDALDNPRCRRGRFRAGGTRKSNFFARASTSPLVRTRGIWSGWGRRLPTRFRQAGARGAAEGA